AATHRPGAVEPMHTTEERLQHDQAPDDRARGRVPAPVRPRRAVHLRPARPGAAARPPVPDVGAAGAADDRGPTGGHRGGSLEDAAGLRPAGPMHRRLRGGQGAELEPIWRLQMRVGVVITTIRGGDHGALPEWRAATARHPGDLQLYVAGDVGTPDQPGLLPLEEQARRWPQLHAAARTRRYGRKSFGYPAALEDGCEAVFET